MLMRIIIVISLMTSLPLQADQCGEQLVKCEQIMEMSKSIIHNQQRELRSQLDTVIKLDIENQSLLENNLRMEEDSKSWYRNPLIVGILGFATGVVAIELAK